MTSKPQTAFNVAEEATKLCEVLGDGSCCANEKERPPCDEENCHVFKTVKQAYVAGYKRGLTDGHGDLV